MLAKFLPPTPRHPNSYGLFFVFSRWNFSSINLNFHEGTLVCKYLPKSVFSRHHDQKGLDLVHRILLVPLGSICLLSSSQVSKASPKSLGMWC